MPGITKSASDPDQVRSAFSKLFPVKERRTSLEAPQKSKRTRNVFTGVIYNNCSRIENWICTETKVK